MNWRAANIGGHEFGAIDHRVEVGARQQADQVFAGVALHPAGFDVDAVELAFADVGVVALQLLLGAQLHAEVGELALAALAVLAGAVFSLVHGALRAAPDILADTAIDLVFRLTALSHRVLLMLHSHRGGGGVLDFQSLRGDAPSCARREFPGADRPSPYSLKGPGHGSRNASRAETGPRAGGF